MYTIQVDNILNVEELDKLIKLAGRDTDGGGCYIPTGARDACWNYQRLERAVDVFIKFCKVRNAWWQIQLIRDKSTS